MNKSQVCTKYKMVRFGSNKAFSARDICGILNLVAYCSESKDTRICFFTIKIRQITEQHY